MTLRAVFLAHVGGNESLPADQILAPSDRLEVCWINTATIATQMIKIEAIRDWLTIGDYPYEAMRWHQLLADIQLPIAIRSHASQPRPASIRLADYEGSRTKSKSRRQCAHTCLCHT